MNSYNCLPVQELKLNNYSIVPIRYIDIQEIRRWRNEQIDVLRQKTVLSKSQQAEYYELVIKKSFFENQPAIVLFSFLLEKDCIGYGGLTNINWQSKNAELSFICETERSKKTHLYQKDFSVFLKLIKELSFEYLKFVKLCTETYDIRDNHVKILEEHEFILTSTLIKNELIRKERVNVLFHSLYNKQNLENKIHKDVIN
tara:strand:+ start:194 stop:793 length:600 start_codon:yes stop_codon:yes gene_type:complete